ncbi:MAG: HNH endonuclease [Clostridia bacterium]|nr:HNH endonuclease [Clostridia bacterium]
MKKRIKILKEGDSRCAYCGIGLSQATFTLDHARPKSRGGSNYYENLKPCCKFCNHIKGSYSIESFKKHLIELSKMGSDLGKKVKSKFHLAESDSPVIFYFEKKEEERIRLYNLLYNV